MSLFPIKDNEIAAMKLGDALYWAIDDDGLLSSWALLEHIAQVRGYDPYWVRHVYMRDWEEVVEETERWRKHKMYMEG
jgi:hypothetical protein